jgi:AcrR family transcriptional regulator
MSLREDILEVSRTLLVKDGFGKMSMRKIAKRAGVSATSIYLHFQNKDELLLALIESSIAKLAEALNVFWLLIGTSIPQFKLSMFEGNVL